MLERLLLKGSIVVKKAYCDWDRYREFKAAMHEASFELIEIPHVRQSGKNSADIRMVVDALDLCYTKSHVDTFVIVSGDSDFSPLVSKLRENDKARHRRRREELDVGPADRELRRVHLLRRPRARGSAPKRRTRKKAPRQDGGRRPRASAPKRRRSRTTTRSRKRSTSCSKRSRRSCAERGDDEKIWGSMVKQALKRRKPGFNEAYYGFGSFNELLEEGQARDAARSSSATRSRAATRCAPRASARRKPKA